MIFGQVENVVFLDMDEARARSDEVGESVRLLNIGWCATTPEPQSYDPPTEDEPA